MAVVALVLAACGGSPAVSDAASTSLEARVAEIRQLAAGRQADGVTARLAEFGAEVERLRSEGEISAAAAERILGAARAVEQQVRLITTTTTTTTAPPPTTAAPARDQEQGQRKARVKKEDD